jgi:hypothetical protein
MHDASTCLVQNLFCMMWKMKKKLFHLCHHNEKLAIAFGLINPNHGTPFQLRINL